MENRLIKLKLRGVSKTFESKGRKFMAVKNVDLDVYDGEFLVLLGPGLCGKTVLLNMIAGLEETTTGTICLNDKELKGPNRAIGMVFQKKALLPWKTVMQNVEFGPQMAGVSKKEIRKTAQKFIDLVGLQGFENSYPHQISGGMKQRAGIARAYANNPELLILDEPFGALDAQTRYSMQDEILRIWKAEKKTILFVTNNIEEALYLGDRIVLLGRCPAEVKEIYDINLTRPRDMISEEFLALRQKISDNMDLSV